MTAIADLAMRPDSLLQWLNTLVPADDAEVGVIFDGLVSEMIDRDVSIVDLRAVSLAFSPLVHASKDRIEEETTREQALIRRRWGATAVRDMTDVEGLDAVITADLYFREKVAELQRELDGERARTERAVATQRMTERERANFEQLKADKEARERRIARRQRQVEGKRRRR